MFKKKFLLILVLTILFVNVVTMPVSVAAGSSSFKDVPNNHWAFIEVNELRELGITDGIGNNMFGLGKTIKRSEFVTYLIRLMGWELISPVDGSFTDNMDRNAWYYSYIETALQYQVIDKTERFFPEKPITREDMAVMIVKALGYDTLAKQLDTKDIHFKDVLNNVEYITMAESFGIINGFTDNTFRPEQTATREHAAAMIMRMYRNLNKKLDELHAFYAISSASQQDLISQLDAVSFGWSRLEYDHKMQNIILNTTNANNNYFALPTGFYEPLSKAKNSLVSAQLMVYADNETFIDLGHKKVALLEYILTDDRLRSQTVNLIVDQINSTVKDGITASFDGVVIDFECMQGKVLRESFNLFLDEIRLHMREKNIYVAVPPKREPGQVYYDGYDYRHIGEIADRVILMAHDYNAKKLTQQEMTNGYTLTPLTPVDEIYYALDAITDKDEGIDKEKIWLQVSFDAVQWKLKDGKIINQYPYTPDYQSVYNRLIKDTNISFSETIQNPYATFYDSSDNTDNVLWYEDSRSVKTKVKLAKLFGIKGISIWRLGNVPNYAETSGKKVYLNVWEDLCQ